MPALYVNAHCRLVCPVQRKGQGKAEVCAATRKRAMDQAKASQAKTIAREAIFHQPATVASSTRA
jgi:hypothetical protein